jgi:hypothetical protein
MKKILTTSNLLAALLIAGTSFSQSVTCDLFSVTGLAIDDFNPNNTLINIQMGGSETDFANYPFITSITDCTGDTVATGSMFFFGQIGSTEQGYPVSALPENVCLPLSIEFVFGNDLFENDTCIFSYGTTGLNAGVNPIHDWTMYPNPAHNEIEINSNPAAIGASYVLLNATGQEISTGIIQTTKDRIDLSNVSCGFYLLHISGTYKQLLKI